MRRDTDKNKNNSFNFLIHFTPSEHTGVKSLSELPETAYDIWHITGEMN